MRVLAIVPVSETDPEYRNGEILSLAGKPILDYTFDALLGCREIEQVLLSTDSDLVADYCRKTYPAVRIHLRQPTTRSIMLNELFNIILENFERDTALQPTHILQAWVNYPFRAADLFSRVINKAVSENLESVFCAYPEYNTYWHYTETALNRITPDETKFRSNRRPIFRDLKGLCSIASVEIVRRNVFLSEGSSIFRVEDFLCTINTHDLQGYYLAPLAAQVFNPKNTRLENIYGQLRPPELQIVKKRQVLLAARNLKAGQTIDESHVCVGEHAYGLSDSLRSAVVGHKLIYDLQANEPITFGYFEL